MRKKLTCIIGFIIIICIIFLLPSFLENQETQIGYFRTFLERHNYHEEAAYDKTRIIQDSDHLLVNGIESAYDKSKNIYYCPISIDIKEGDSIKIELSFSKMGESIYINNEIVDKNFELQIKFNHAYQIKANSFLFSNECSLIFTQMPTMIINSVNSISKDTKASIICIDPNYIDNNKGYILYEGDSLLSLRGGMTFGYPKKNYKLKLYDNFEGEVKESLFGMREDDDWILEASYNEMTKMRKKVLMDIWGDMSTLYYNEQMRNAPESKFVEVFVNDNYCGLYIISERIDRKLLDLKDNPTGKSGGVIYKTKAWRYDDQPFARFNAPAYDVDPYSQEWLVFDCEYPQLENTGYIDWTPYYNLSHLVDADIDIFNDYITDAVDLDNLAEYFIFVNLIKGEDNIGKNIIWSVVDTSDDELNKMFITAYDLDWSMGRDVENNAYSTTGILTNKLFSNLIKNNTNNFADLVNGKWSVLRGSIITKEYITNAFLDEYYYLNNAGCFAREGATWHVNSDKPLEDTALEEIYYISNWVEERINYLDEAIPELQDRFE